MGELILNPTQCGARWIFWCWFWGWGWYISLGRSLTVAAIYFSCLCALWNKRPKSLPLRRPAGMELLSFQQLGSTYLLTLVYFDSDVMREKGECNVSVRELEFHSLLERRYSQQPRDLSATPENMSSGLCY